MSAIRISICILVAICITMEAYAQKLDTIKVIKTTQYKYVWGEPSYVSDHRAVFSTGINSATHKALFFMDTTAKIEWYDTIDEMIKNYSKTVTLNDCSYIVKFISAKNVYSNLAYVKDLNNNKYYPLSKRISARNDETFYIVASLGYSLTNVDTNNNVLWSTVVDTGICPYAKVLTAKDNGCLVINNPYLRKYSPSGVLEWTLPLPSTDHAQLMFGDNFPNGDFLIALNRNNNGALLLRVTNEGQIVWQRPLQKDADFGSSVRDFSRKGDKFLLFGSVARQYPSGSSALTTLIDASGNYVWYFYDCDSFRSNFGNGGFLLKNDSSFLAICKDYGAGLFEFNYPPVFKQSLISLRTTARVGELYTDTIAATDEFPGDSVHYFSISGLPGFTIDSISGIIRWIPAQKKYASSEKVILVAQDRLKQTAVYSYFITVLPAVNSAPVLRELRLSSSMISEGDSVSFRVMTKDNDNDNVKIAWLLNGKDTLSKQIAMMYRTGYKSSLDSIIVAIYDNKGNENRKQVPLTVQNKPLPPVPLLATNAQLHFGDTITWTWGDYGIDPDLDINNLSFNARFDQTGVASPKHFIFNSIKQHFIVLNDSLLSKMNDKYYSFEFAIEAHDAHYTTGMGNPVKLLFKSTDSNVPKNISPGSVSTIFNKRTGELLISLTTENSFSPTPLHVSILNLQGKTVFEKSYRYGNGDCATSIRLPCDFREVARGMLIARIQYTGVKQTYVIPAIW